MLAVVSSQKRGAGQRRMLEASGFFKTPA